MKHIKHYENIDDREFKDFVVLKSLTSMSTIPLFLVSTDRSKDQKDDRYYFIRYRFYEDGDTNNLKDGETTTGDIRKSDIIIYHQSDDYQECLEILNLLSNANKYNL